MGQNSNVNSLHLFRQLWLGSAAAQFINTRCDQFWQANEAITHVKVILKMFIAD